MSNKETPVQTEIKKYLSQTFKSGSTLTFDSERGAASVCSRFPKMKERSLMAESVHSLLYVLSKEGRLELASVQRLVNLHELRWI